LADVQAESLATLGILPNRTLEARRESLNAAIEIAEKAGLLATAARAHLNIGGYLQELGEMPAALQHVQQARLLAHHIGMTAWEHNFASAVGEFCLEIGDFGRVEQTLVDLRQLEINLPDPASAAMETNLLQVQLCRARGEWDTAINLCQKYFEDARQKDDSKHSLALQMILVQIHLEKDEFEAAHAILKEIVDEFIAAITDEKPWALLLMCFTYIGLGQLEQAHRQIEEITSFGKTDPSPRVKMIQAWADARLAVAEKLWDAAFAGYDTFYGIASQASLRLRQANIREEWAGALALRNEPGDLPRAREMMREAITLFEQMNAPQYVTRLRGKLRKMTG
jgi:tetratricopeptide (TPR) repeat protein